VAQLGRQTAMTVCGIAVLATIVLAAPQPAQVLTIVLNIVNQATSDRNGVT